MEDRRDQISAFRVTAFKVPTDAPESDGTLSWNSTTLCLVELQCRDQWGLGYTYGHASIAGLIGDLIQQCVQGQIVHHSPKIWGRLVGKIRNDGEFGPSAMAVSAIDVALWDLKAKILGVPLHHLLGESRDTVEAYGSGGFTSYTPDRLAKQFSAWREMGFKKFKMKVGRNPRQDIERVSVARDAIGPDGALFVDANGAYDVQQALVQAEEFTKYGVEWFEQPIDPEDLDGMRFLRQRLPAGMQLATGEYIYDLAQVLSRARANGEDFIQLDVTRCKGITGYLRAAAVCQAFHLPLSSHCAPALHIALGASLPNFRHLEYFHDHARIEQMIFDGTVSPSAGFLKPGSAPGHGLKLKQKDAEKYRI